MLNKEKHQLIMGQILRDIYTDISISSFLGFKGGTCAYFFYGLPRFSVDLDFDLLSEDKVSREMIFKKIENILKKYGKIKNSFIKRNTIFLLLSYGNDDHNIKIEISTRNLIPKIENFFEIKEYLGISILVAKKEYMFASKLAALTLRNSIATRDVYDIWYFLKKNWEIDKEIIKIRTKQNIKDYLDDCVLVIEKVKKNQILQGLGELLDEKEKAWVKNNLKEETIFLLENYQMAILKE